MNTSSFQTCLVLLSLMAVCRAQDSAPQTPSIILHPHEGWDSKRSSEVRRIEKTAAQGSLRKLADDSQVLADVYETFVNNTPNFRTPERDAIELDMWRRGDVTIRILKERFVAPHYEGTRPALRRFLLIRPWLKPAEFLPLMRQEYSDAENQPDQIKQKGRRMDICEFLAQWGEPQDKPIVSGYKKFQPDPFFGDRYNAKFADRLNALKERPPDGIPDWLLRYKDFKEETAIPEPFKTYQEVKGTIPQPPVPDKPVPLVPPAADSAPEAARPPWLMLGGAVVVLVVLLVLGKRMAGS